MRNTTAIVVLSGALLTAGWGVATGYAMRHFAKAWFAAAAAGAQHPSDVGGKPAPHSVTAARERYRAEECSGDYVCDEQGAWATSLIGN